MAQARNSPPPTPRKTHPNLWHTVCGKSLSEECAAFRDLQYLEFFFPQLDLVTVGGKLIFSRVGGGMKRYIVIKSLHFRQRMSNIQKIRFQQMW
jgi:hypothetical protein